MSGEDVVMRDADVQAGPSEEQVWNAKTSRATTGLRDQSVADKVERIKRAKQMVRNRDGRQGEADRHIGSSKPKHMLVGKRKMGKTNRR
jgi:nucleolar GTP-binding protein